MILVKTACNQKNKLSFDSQINNHGKHLINLSKNSDMRILNGRTKGDSFGRATFHGNNGISVVDYMICDQEIFENANYFVVKSPSYLSDHSQIITWIDIDQTIEEPDTGPCNIEMSKLPNQFIWNNDAKNNFRETLRSPEIQRKMNEFVDSNFTNDLNGINKYLCEFQKILLETSKKCLKIKKSKLRRKITNVVQKKCFFFMCFVFSDFWSAIKLQNWLMFCLLCQFHNLFHLRYQSLVLPDEYLA